MNIGRSVIVLITTLTAWFACMVGTNSFAAAQLSEDEMVSYLVERACPTSKGQVELSIFRPECHNSRYRQEEDKPATYRHDWPAQKDAIKSPAGYQRSGSYLASRFGQRVMMHTYDFGTAGRTFGVFDRGRGDGGGIAELHGRTAAITVTEDGGSGVQWFLGPLCRGELDPSKSGWVLFTSQVSSLWHHSVVLLRKEPEKGRCPTVFDKSFTQWHQGRNRLSHSSKRETGSAKAKSPVD